MSGVYDFVDNAQIERDLAQQKSLLIGVSRTLDKLAGRRQPAERRAAPGGGALVAGIAADLASRAHNKELAAELKTKAAVAPAMTDVSGWASELAAEGLPGLILSVRQRSAAAGILARSPQVSLLGAGTLRVVVAGSVPPATIIGEGNAIPVYQGGTFSPLVMTPVKFAAIIGFTSELQRASNIEDVTRMMLGEAIASGLDLAYFGAVSPGILDGLTPEAASAATDPLTALTADLSTLLGALDSPSADVVFAMNPSQALIASALLPPSFAYSLAQSSALPVGTVVAVDAAGCAAAIGEAKVKTTEAATIHQETEPTALSVAGSPNTIAAPTRSYYQTDSVGVRIVAHVAWVCRPGAVSFMTDAAW